MGALEVAVTGPLLIVPGDHSDALDLSLVLPTYNEVQNINVVIEQLVASLDSVSNLSYEIIVVDDDSPDRTWEKAQELSERFTQVRVVRRQGERGLSTAVLRGWQQARGQIFGVMDSDRQHPAETSCALWTAMTKGSDLAVASRHIKGGGVSHWSIGRRMISRCAQGIGIMVLPEVLIKVRDPMSGYFMIRRSSLEGRELRPLGYKLLVEVLGRGAMGKITEVPYIFRERSGDASKISIVVCWQYLRHLLRLRIDLLKSSQFVRFCMVGASGTLIDTTMLYLLSDPHTLNWGLTRSKIVAAELALTNNFIWNDLWTFGRFAAGQNSFRERFRRFLRFNLICSVGIMFNLILLNIGFNYFHMNRYIANLGAILLVTLWNYNVNRRLSWRTAAKK